MAVTAAVLCGLDAGLFLTYQVSVVRGLALLDDVTYVSTFQALNATIRTAPFFVVFFLSGPVALAAAWTTGSRPVRTLFGLAGGAMLVVVAITFAGNVPLNERLAPVAVDPTTATAARDRFEDPWNGPNLARTLVGLVGAGAAAAGAAWSQPARRP